MSFQSMVRKCINIACHVVASTFSKCVRVNDRVIVFLSFHGKGVSDSPKALFEAIKQDPFFSEYELVWCLKKPKEIEGAKVVKYLSLDYFYTLARAKFWIFNCKMPAYIVKKPNQYYLQTWHGTPLKRLGHDILVDENTTFYRSKMSYEQMCRTYDVDVARYNWMISPNAFCSKVFLSAFKINKERLIETGYPRNDVLSKPNDIKEQKQKLNLPLDKKVILYAPTWRDNDYQASGYTFELKVDFKAWKKMLGDEYVVLFKPHYLISNSFVLDPSLSDFVYLIDAKEDIASLYPISDCLVTDYSSVFFDYAILNRPIYFYMYDLKEYANDLRGFYLDIHTDLPGPVYQREEDLLKGIKEGVVYDLSKFHETFNTWEDGHACDRVIEVLKQAV